MNCVRGGAVRRAESGGGRPAERAASSSRLALSLLSAALHSWASLCAHISNAMRVSASPGAPVSKFSQHGDFKADFTFDQQDEALERGIELAKAFQTDRVRCFDFWRLDDQRPYRAAINEKLLQAANKAGKKGITLLLENDSGLNTATGAEAAKVLDAVKSPYLMMNWDPGNAAASGEKPFPDGYNLLPKDRIGHCHCKDAVKKGNDYEWAPMGAGIVDWLGQFKAFKRDGYRFAVSLETHWDGGGTPEKSSRRSWAGMKQLLQEAGAL